MQQAALFRGREHRQRVGGAGRAEVGALERIDGDVHLRAGVRVAGLGAHADTLADVEHRRLVALALADDDGAVDRHRVHLVPHRFDRHLVRLVAIALSHRVGARDGRLLDDADEVERQVGVDVRIHRFVGLRVLDLRARRRHCVCSTAGSSQRDGLSVR